MADFLQNVILPHFNYWVSVILMMIGLHAMIAKNNLIKKLIGMSIFQTAIILFYVSMGVKKGATIPILPKLAEGDPPLDPALVANPLPHVLMLTAIVVGVATLGVALAIAQAIYRDFGTLEEDRILSQIKTHRDV